MAQACCKCREAWHDTQRCSKAVHALPGRPELSQVAQELSLTRCDVCGAGVERTEVSNHMCACGGPWMPEVMMTKGPCCLALPSMEDSLMWCSMWCVHCRAAPR